MIESETFTLDNFEGPLDLLWHLIHREEIDIYQISLFQITNQFLQRMNLKTVAQNGTLAQGFGSQLYLKEQNRLDEISQPPHPSFLTEAVDLDRGAEFISMTASLIWFKSKALLPKHEQEEDETTLEEDDPRFEIIHQLIDYCRFKQAAKELADRELRQGAFYPRGVESSEIKKNLGINHLSLEDLAVLFQQILAKAEPRRGTITEEEWKVSDKIHYLKELLKKRESIPFTEAFNASMSRIELIVTFLALLEMMKSEDVWVKNCNQSQKSTVHIFARR